jgi:hypothetical protein
LGYTRHSNLPCVRFTAAFQANANQWDVTTLMQYVPRTPSRNARATGNTLPAKPITSGLRR